MLRQDSERTCSISSSGSAVMRTSIQPMPALIASSKARLRSNGARFTSSRYFNSCVLTWASSAASCALLCRASTLKSRRVRRSVPISQSMVGLTSL